MQIEAKRATVPSEAGQYAQLGKHFAGHDAVDRSREESGYTETA